MLSIARHVRGLLALPLILLGCQPRDVEHATAPPAAPRALYAQRIAELHLDSPTGPVIGRIHPGARFDVSPAGSGHVRIQLPAAFARDDKAAVFAFVDQDVFSALPRSIVAPAFPTESRRVKDAVRLDLAVTSNGQPFASTICGELQRLSPEEPNDGPVQVAQVFAGIELVGWVETGQWVRRGLQRCGARVVVRRDGRLLLAGGTTSADGAEVTAIPLGFVGGVPLGRDELAARIDTSGSVYWLIATSPTKTTCREWTFNRAPKDGPTLVRTAPIQSEGTSAFASFGVAYTKQELLLFGPHFTKERLDKFPRSPAIGGYKCGIGYSFAGADNEAIWLSVVGTSSSTLVAWHPDDEEHWYLSEAACDAARLRADRALQRDPNATPPGGLHADCFDELNEP